MTSEQKRLLMLATTIGILFDCYEEDEKTKLHRELRRRLFKGTMKYGKKLGIEDSKQVIMDSHDIWQDAVNHFAEAKILFEASICILTLWNYEPKQLEKHFGLSRSKIGQWAKLSSREDKIELEENSRMIAKFIFSKANDHYGIKEEKTPSPLSLMIQEIQQKKQHDLKKEAS